MARSNEMTRREGSAPFCIGIVASSGGIDALIRVLSPMPKDFPAAIVIVLHIMPDRPSQLARVLSNGTSLKVEQVLGGELLEPGVILVAPPDKHVEVLGDGTTVLNEDPKEHHSRPSGNPLFFSLAEHYGRCGIAVVLTGYDGDGAEGLLAVKKAGGATLVQDEATSAQYSMPRTAVETGAVDQVLDVDGIARALTKLVSV